MCLLLLLDLPAAAGQANLVHGRSLKQPRRLENLVWILEESSQVNAC